MNISGRTVLLTGATGGIGRALAHQLAQRGAVLAIVGRDATRLADLADELRSANARVRPLVADIGRLDAHARLVSSALELTGRLDILVSCAGVQSFCALVDEPAQAAGDLINVNTVAPIALTRTVLPHMLANDWGRIVYVGSIFGSIGFPFFASYSASKFALRGFSEALRRELAGTRVEVSYVAPRFTRTAFNRSALVRMADALKMNQDEPDLVAARIVAAIESGGRNHYLGWPEKLFVRINSLLPRLVDQPLMKQVDQMRPFAADRSR